MNMGHLSKHFRTLAALPALALAAAAPLQAQGIDAGDIVVTPNRTPTDKAKVGSKVDVVGKEEIEAQSKTYILDYLTLVPGVYVASPGGAGQESSVSVRGADKKYIKTLFNGIDISDPTSTQVQTSYQNLLAGGIANIEVLKGSQSTLYGSDAVAGVIGISTLGAVEPGLHHDVFLEGGSLGTARGGYALSGASATGKASLGLFGVTTDGISAADSRFGNLERDSYRNLTATFAGEQQLNEYVSIFGAGLLINAQNEFDDGGNPPVDNPFNDGKSTQKAGRVGLNLDLLDGRFKNTVSVQHMDIDRDLHLVSMFGPFDANYRGKRSKIDYQGSFGATDWLTVQFGSDYEGQTAAVTDNYGTNTRDSFNLLGAWSQAIIEPVENLTLTAAYRHDEHSVFGGYGTYRFTGAYLLPAAGTRLHASYGTGYRAPSLYELYAPFGTGNAALQPEESMSFDIGVEQSFLDGALVADVTYFQLDTDNLIDYSYATFSYVQLPGLTKRNGVEASLRWAVNPWLDIGGAYTYTRTRQPDGLSRPRIPAHDFVLTATVRPAEKWSVTATAHAVIDTSDRISPSTGTFLDVPLDDYLLLDARIAYKPTEETELYVRGENLLNEKYQLVRGYGTPGVRVFAGFKASF